MTVSPLTVESLHKSYGDQKVLDGVDLTLAAGEIFGLVGLNGVGKTTLIKIVLDLARADSGTARLSGIDSRLAEARKDVAYLPEKFLPSRQLGGHEFLELALSYYGKAYDRAEAAEMAKRLSLDPAKLGSRIAAYSKGMGQKLGLMSAFLCGARLLILDEPMSGLDPSARIELKSLLLEQRGLGKTIFFSSHILSDMDEICDRIGAIHARRLFFTGPAHYFKQAYPGANLEKCFLGAITAIDAEAA